MITKHLIPIPDLLEAKNVLTIVPHPDDAELIAAGTISILTSLGAHVEYVLASDGSRGGYDPSISEENLAATRRQEQTRAARIIGVNDITWLGFKDTQVPHPEVVRGPLISIIREKKPDFILTTDPWLPYESHPDHRRTSMAAVEACLFSSIPMVQPEDLAKGLGPWQVQGIAMALSPRPNTFINIEASWEKKVEALKCHESQFPPKVWEVFYTVIAAKCKEYGASIGAQWAEAFKVVTPTHLHVMPDTWDL
ncbi:MAG TPA: PIG-L family deacetylase [Bacillota bacterium]|nr:PIG-L family deacetylase [Bacillota bacterium]